MAFSVVISNDWQSRLFSGKSNETKTFHHILQDKMRRMFENIGSPVPWFLCPPRHFESREGPGDESVLTIAHFQVALSPLFKHCGFLRAHGIPEKLVAAITASYAHGRAKVMSPDGETMFFAIHTGVLQGHTLAPFLLVQVLLAKL